MGFYWENLEGWAAFVCSQKFGGLLILARGLVLLFRLCCSVPSVSVICYDNNII